MLLAVAVSSSMIHSRLYNHYVTGCSSEQVYDSLSTPQPLCYWLQLLDNHYDLLSKLGLHAILVGGWHFDEDSSFGVCPS